MIDYDNFELRNVRLVTVKKSRWRVQIEFTFKDTNIPPLIMIATNDSFYTGGDGIWWDTLQATEEEFNSQYGPE